MTRPILGTVKRTLPVLLLLSGCATSPQPAGTEAWFPGDPGLPWRAVGTSVEGRAVYAAEFGSGPEITLVFAGFHGNEKTAIDVLLAFCAELRWHGPLLEGRRVVVVPVLNPDGYVAGTRHNARKVDLNRNFPTKDWGAANLRKKDAPGPAPASEPETRAAIALVERLRPAKIVSLHDPYRVNNFDGAQSEELAKAMAQFNGYPVKASIGYPTPGSFGTWAGVERGIGMVTLEIPDGSPAGRWRENRWALVAAVRFRPGS